MGHLTEMQRYTIQKLHEQKFTIKFIAETIGKDKSVISREIRRNIDQRSKKYNAGLAQRKYEKRQHEKPKHVRFTPSMKETVESMLREDYSPEQIRGRMKLLGTDMVSHEWIYQCLAGQEARRRIIQAPAKKRQKVPEEGQFQRFKGHHQGQGRHREPSENRG